MSADVNGVPSRNLMESVESVGCLTLLCKALDVAGLTLMLSVSGPYTIFAPNDAAFRKLSKGTFQAWLEPENRAELLCVLRYHILARYASAADVGTMSRPKMLQGQSAFVTKEGDKIRIDDANLIRMDIASSNGVIHMIDTVMQPIEAATKY